MKEPVLSDRVMTMLMSSEYALLISRSPSERLSDIVDIASLHTKEELVCKPGLGRGTVRQIETWLGFHGRRLRLSSESIDSVICTFDFRKRSRRRSRGMSETMTRGVESRGRNGTQLYID